MKVLVTGSSGFIGSALSIRLLDRGDAIYTEIVRILAYIGLLRI
jgi:nucleoside-diphosphate-sugar epimerase